MGWHPPPCSCLYLLMPTCALHTCPCLLLEIYSSANISLCSCSCPSHPLVPFLPPCAFTFTGCPYFIISSLCILYPYLNQLLWFLLKTRFIFARRSRQGVTTLFWPELHIFIKIIMYAFWNLLFTFEFVFTVEFLCDINKKNSKFYYPMTSM